MTRVLAPLLAAFLCTLAPRMAGADEATSPQREAGRHFERAVVLYAEADYQGALVEFKRAYATAPNPIVLYNIGETEFQLQDYAGALGAFTRYMGESPPGAAHRAEVETTVEVLRGRVGHLGIASLPPGAEIAVDDVVVGKTPLADRVLVSVGHRKVSATLAGHVPVVRYVDVAADDNAAVTLEIGEPAPHDQAALTPAPPGGPAAQPSASRGPGALRTTGWVATAMLAAGAAGAGALALKAQNDLEAARGTYPVSPATLQADADHTRTYSILADSLTAGAVVVGGVTLFSMLVSGGAGPSPRVGVHLSPASMELRGTF